MYALAVSKSSSPTLYLAAPLRQALSPCAALSISEAPSLSRMIKRGCEG
jgi:hypothetical protein